MAGSTSALAELKVVATIKPIHALVAGVMTGVGEPKLLIDGAGSPHTFALKPSDARALNQADIIFRVSDGLEPFMIKVLTALPKSVRVVTLEDAPGLTLHKMRTGATFEQDAHDHDHGHKGAREKRPTPTATTIMASPARNPRRRTIATSGWTLPTPKS
ncbi:MAG: zinc ABC transporter solute-binding protein [Rhodospirillales bacterium]|nr:zinc ABC transporter solute-binding protein [Rhodospirillales bacterium]